MMFLVAFSVLTIGGYVDAKLLIREFKMLLLLRMNLHSEKAKTYLRKYGLHSFEEEELEREQNNLFEQSGMNDNMLPQEDF